MKYYKTENSFGKQPNNIIPPDSIEITPGEYAELEAKFNKYWADVNYYVDRVRLSEITLDDVPEEYREEVSAIINTPEPEQLYTLDEASEIISQEVSS